MAEAITAANSNTAGGGCAAGSSTATDTINITSNINIGGTALTISEDLEINGGGNTLSGTASLLKVSGSSSSVHFTVTINNLKMTNNNTANPAIDGALRADNGAILVINDSEIFNTKSTSVGPAINFRENAESLTISDSIIRDNSTSSFAGAIYVYFANVTIEDSTFSRNNLGSSRNAGAIYYSSGGASTLIVRRSTFSDNEGSLGGAIYVSTGTLTVSDSEFRDNSATSNGGAIYGKNNSVVMNISGSTFSGNTSAGSGGAINSGSAGIDLTVTNSVFLNNSTTGDGNGGAIRSIAQNTKIYRSYFSDNRANRSGGAIYADTAMRLENSTFYNNRAVNGGGALASGDVLSGRAVDIRHVTLVDNEATGSGANGNSVSFHASSVASIYNSIIKEKASAAGTDCVGVDNNTSTISDNSGCSSSTGFNVNPRLSSRRGSPTQYYPLRHDSPAIDAANVAACNALNEAVDQRGRSRPYGEACDIGAYEWYPPPPDAAGRRGGSGRGQAATPVPPPGPVCAFCADLLARGYRLSATFGLESGVQFRRLDRRGIGNQAVLDAGFLDAIDVYGYAEQGVEVCFPRSGRLLFLDAAYAPRTQVPLEAYSDDGLTCGETDRAGTIVLIQGPPAPARARAVESVAVAARRLQGCMVTTGDMLRFRESPAGAPLQYIDPWGRLENGWLPSTVTLTALERTADWFKVDYYGTRGWVSADYVSPQGSCG